VTLAPRAVPFSLRLALFFPLVLSAALAGAPSAAADDPIVAATKLYEKRRYEQAARTLEDALPRLDAARRGEAQILLAISYLQDAELHAAFARAAAAAELDYLGKLVGAGGEDRSRYARLYLAEALLAQGNAREAARHFERVRADPGVDALHRTIAGVGLGSARWVERRPAQARELWARAGGAAEVVLARAAAEGHARAMDASSLARAAEKVGSARGLSPRSSRYLIEIHLAAGSPDKALAVVRAANLGAPSYTERFKAVRGTAKTIAFYDLALLSDLAQLYRELARARLEQAAADPRIKPSAEYYLGEALSALGENDAALSSLQAFLARPQAPAQYRERARARAALIAHRRGQRAEAEKAWTSIAGGTNDPEVLAEIVLGCAEAGAPCAKVLARAERIAETGEARRNGRLNFALGDYLLRNKDYARAIARMEAARDKSNKNKIEANNPEMLAALAEAYYRTKQFSEGLEIFFEMSSEFPAVRQIQEAVQGVYSMEQRSAGDVRIL
jgi:tetratricopeptide (TPR) repeat protein